MKTAFRLFTIFACLFMFGTQPVLAEGQGGEGQGLNEPGYGEASAGVFEMLSRKLRILNEEYL